MAIGAGAAVALLLAAGGDSSSTTTVLRRTTTTPAPPAPPPVGGSIEAGRYVQAGTFQTPSHAETERLRLAGQGIEVEVVPSDEAQELYPGFQVLLRGPLLSAAEETTMLKSLHQNGVPSAFARGLTPAAPGEAEEIAGGWTGEVERTIGEDPKLDGTLPATVSIAADGTAGSLDFPTLGCRSSLSLVSSTGYTVSYEQNPACAAGETITVRLDGDQLMLTLLSPSTDSFALGTLNRD
jgi:hypothetical protein